MPRSHDAVHSTLKRPCTSRPTSRVGYRDDGQDCGVWGTRTDTPDSLQNIKICARRHEFDDRLRIDRERDLVFTKRGEDTDAERVRVFAEIREAWTDMERTEGRRV